MANRAAIGRLEDAFAALGPGHPFHVLIKNGSMFTGLYAPGGEDRQQPHEQDEVYIVVRGSAALECDGNTLACTAGDVLFVPARVGHRFVQMSEDFATWAVFYGPAGGEPAK